MIQIRIFLFSFKIRSNLAQILLQKFPCLSTCTCISEMYDSTGLPHAWPRLNWSKIPVLDTPICCSRNRIVSTIVDWTGIATRLLKGKRPVH